MGGVLLLGVVGGGIYKIGSHASDRLYNKALAPASVSSGTTESTDSTTLSGSDTITGVSLTGSTTGTQDTLEVSENLSGDIAIPEYVATSGTNTSEPKTDTFDPTPTPEATPAPTPTYSTVIPSQGNLNYAQVIPYLVNTYKLKNTS